MASAAKAGVTVLLARAREGDGAAMTSLTEMVYGELRSLAAAYMKRERAGHTLQPTALANEALVQLLGSGQMGAKDRAHFFALASGVMRRVLVDHARTRGAAKRGGDRQRVNLNSSVAIVPDADVEALALDDALNRLAHLDERQARVVELRFFGGLSMDDVAEQLGVSKRTAESDWTLARAWLHRELTGVGGSTS
jgi:RNA polymerase sigma factor (TIGR02999 family)